MHEPKKCPGKLTIEGGPVVQCYLPLDHAGDHKFSWQESDTSLANRERGPIPEGRQFPAEEGKKL